MAYSRRIYKRQAEAAEKQEAESEGPPPSPGPTIGEPKIFGHKHATTLNSTCNYSYFLR